LTAPTTLAATTSATDATVVANVTTAADATMTSPPATVTSGVIIVFYFPLPAININLITRAGSWKMVCDSPSLSEECFK
jgi:hypothetical protein